MPRNATNKIKSLYSVLLPWVAGAVAAACVLALASLYFEDYIVKLIGLGILFFLLVGTLIKMYREGKIPFR